MPPAIASAAWFLSHRGHGSGLTTIWSGTAALQRLPMLKILRWYRIVSGRWGDGRDSSGAAV